MKLTIDLNDKEVEQLICCFMAGSIVMEDEYLDHKGTMYLQSKINKLALEVGREDLVIVIEEMAKDGIYPPSAKVEDKVLNKFNL